MKVGELFVLFGLKADKQQFKAAHDSIKLLKAAAAVTGIVNLARGVFHLAQEAAEGATHIHSMSQAMGMSIGMAQKWSYVAEQSGSNLTELSIGVSMFIGNLRKLANGDASPRLRRVFRELGVNAADAKLAMTTTDGVVTGLMKASATFQKLGVTGTTAALARMGMGARAGRALAADLIRGPEAIQKMFASLEANGGVVSDKAIIQLQGLYDGLNDIKKAFRGVTSEILGALAPTLTELLNTTAKWFVTHREAIEVVLVAAVKALAVAFRALMVVVTWFTSAFGPSWVPCKRNVVPSPFCTSIVSAAVCA